MLATLKQLPSQSAAWAVLAASAWLLVAAALYFQYGMGLEPCVKCIYQRVAIMAIGTVALLPLVAPRSRIAQWIGTLGWLIAAVKGYLIAAEHVALQNSTNAFFMVCDTFPNFPSFMPLHEWFPSIFGAPGLCGDIDWQFAGLSMPGWMQIIFAAYSVTAILATFALIWATLSRTTAK
ncbi:disulfide bond formation protein DsbB [Pseudidiomarina aestuarii]|uniref:Disulfide bond formation protein B n=1 Tax=Pseudidiomarina aestuarii TaxID=624146 RepID=A0A2T4D4M5_9GAMM|nr:disulfide bond formation protein DsbB [Pseudidiomarina aestuarii]